MKKVRILIVEDEIIIAMEIEAILINLGYSVTSIVNSGEKAINDAKKDQPDIILMDIRLSGEMDGIEAANRINNFKPIPVIFLSANSNDSTINRAKSIPPFGYLLKPVNQRVLKITIEMALYAARIKNDHLKIEAALKESEEINRLTLSNISETVFITDDIGQFTYVGPTVHTNFGYTINEIKKLSTINNLFDKNIFDHDLLIREKEIPNIEYKFIDKNGIHHDLLITVKRVIIKEGTILYTCRDITSRKKIETALELSKVELEETNTALKVLLEKSNEAKKNVEQQVLTNVQTTVLPYIEKLKDVMTDADQQSCLNLLENNLNQLTSTFSATLASNQIHLTPSEINISNLIKHGNSTKEIAQILNLSGQTVEFHRKNIRKKLKISNRSVNLRTYLSSMD